MAKIFQRNCLGIVSAIVTFCAFAMIVAALTTQYWVNVDLLKKDVTKTANKTIVKQKEGGIKHFGLFAGSTTQNLGLGDRSREFDVKNEFEGVANAKVVWAVVGFCCISFPFIFIGIGMTCYNEFSKPNLIVFGSVGIFVIHGIALFMVLIAVCLFAALFEIQLKKNVLREEDRKVGFESTDRARLDYSFWILLGASGVLLLSPFVFLLSKLHLTHYFQTSSKPKTDKPTTDHQGVMLY